jgi:hypothetical protein
MREVPLYLFHMKLRVGRFLMREVPLYLFHKERPLPDRGLPPCLLKHDTPKNITRVERERECCIDRLLVRIHFVIETIWWTGLASWASEFPMKVTLHLLFPRRKQPPETFSRDLQTRDLKSPKQVATFVAKSAVTAAALGMELL